MSRGKVLLTGASGFLGNYIFEYLSRSDYKVNTLGRNATSTIISDISKSSPRINTNFDMVIHCAGKAHLIPKNEEEEQQFYDINYTGTKNLCKALERNLPNTFIFISTIAVYGKDEGSNISESERLDGNTPYAKSKIMAENFLLNWSNKYNINMVILRLPLVAGRYPKGNLGAIIHGIKKGYYFNISKNDAKKSIVLADDIAKLTPSLYKKNGTYNLSGDKDYTFKEISAIIAGQLNNNKIMSVPYFLVKFLAQIGNIFSLFPIDSLKLKKMMSTLTVSSEKAESELGWNPRSLKDNFKI